MIKKNINILPIQDKKLEILDTLKHNQVLIVVGETGSGKTTQLPQFCLEAGYGEIGRIAVTQPRRIAATSMAKRVAEEQGVVLGTGVGYTVRFHEKISTNTRIHFLTDGILLQKILSDRLLVQYQTIIIDEAHERSLTIDFLLGYLKKILPKRPDLRLIISSATIDTSLFSKSFDNAPVIEVSGRLFPVDLLYQPIDGVTLENGSYTYVDGATKVVEDLVDLGDPGDVLVFMPTERDIREAVHVLTENNLYNCLVLPLFSRLTREQQNRIFTLSNKRKIIVATNIAETSITVPGIRFVVDTGLARMNRYSPRLRTNRLPIEPISQASADQRMGRCGRVADGFCIRLYSEEDYQGRRRYALPEIKRSNIAGVILHLLYMRLGEIESFPFLEPPEKRAINDAFAQLTELRAINQEKKLTNIGQKMARLPLEPHISRMIVHAYQENAQKEVAIIAAGLSVGDPKERPSENQGKADAVHKQFIQPGSDFMTFLRLWETYHVQRNNLSTQNKMRRFCKNNFLSYNRMQEWIDIHRQIVQIAKNARYLKIQTQPASIDSIHRSILAGIIANTAVKKERSSAYLATKNREIVIFPGSSLFKLNPEWIMCHEIVETSRVFGRNCAPINPQWLEEIAPSLCTSTYGEPFFDTQTLYVRVYESVFFMGLPIVVKRKKVFSQVDPDAACEVFIREAFVHGKLPSTMGFLINNKKIVEDIERVKGKLRKDPFEGDTLEEKCMDFYRNRITKISSLHELKRIIRKRGGDRFLCMKKQDLVRAELIINAKKLPNILKIGGKDFSLSYHFKPGEEKDGVTITIPQSDLQYIHDTTFTWVVPALWEEKIFQLLKNLPKQLRKKFIPFHENAKKIARSITYSQQPFLHALCTVIYSLFSLRIDPEDFREQELPLYLRMRMNITDAQKGTIAQGRDYASLKKTHASTDKFKPGKESYFEQNFKGFEIYDIQKWDFGDINEQIEITTTDKGFPLYGYPALTVQKHNLNLRLFANQKEALMKHREGLKHLIKVYLHEECAWLLKELQFSQFLKLYSSSFGGEKQLQSSLFDMITNHFMAPPLIYTKKEFLERVEKIKATMRGSGYRSITVFEQVMKQYRENSTLLVILASKMNTSIYSQLKKDLENVQDSYIHHLVKRTVTFQQFQHYPRYFLAFRFRIEKAFADRKTYTARMNIIAPYQKRAMLFKEKFFDTLHPYSFDTREKIEKYLLCVEELYISLFAQHIRTAFPISEKRIQQLLNTIDDGQS